MFDCSTWVFYGVSTGLHRLWTLSYDLLLIFFDMGVLRRQYSVASILRVIASVFRDIGISNGIDILKH